MTFYACCTILGKKDKAAVERILAYVMKITAMIAFVFFVAALCFPKSLMYIFTKEQTLINGGKAAKSSIISSTSVVINLFLNTVLIFGLFGLPKMEIAGAALATVIARVIEVMWCVLETVKNLIACFCLGPASGGGIMVGNELGAGQLETAKIYGKKLCKLAIISGFTSGVVLPVHHKCCKS